MGQTISLAAIYCCCTASSSLCNSCFGTSEIGTTGRKRSVLLLAIVIATSLYFQYYIGPNIVYKNGWAWKLIKWIPFGISNHIQHAWVGDNNNNCDYYYNPNNHNESMKLVSQCAGNAGVLRPTCLSTIYFLINAIVTSKYVGNPKLNREAWPAKYTLFGFALLISIFIPNEPIYTSLYLWFARFGAFIFIILQQIILIDIAYNWNDDWVERSSGGFGSSSGSGGSGGSGLGFGSSNNWLHGIVGICVSLYTACLISVCFMYSHYTGSNGGGGGCAGNTWVITLTLLGIIAITIIQLSGTEGSLLTSGVISLYAIYLCFSIISKNPKGECNPQLGSNNDDIWGITIGLLLTTVSLIWTGWSWSAEIRLLNTDTVQSAKAVVIPGITGGSSSSGSGSGNDNGGGGGGGELNLDIPLMDGEEATTTGIITTTTSSSSSFNSSSNTESSSLNHVWKLNIVLALISCYVAMILTGWGTVDGFIVDGNDDGNGNDSNHNNHNAANPTIGKVNMAILGIAQWLALSLYGWTLIAPRLFPDRDFN